MNEFESNCDAWYREWKFEAWNRECRSSNKVLCFELGIGNGGVRAKFRCLESEMEEFEQSTRFGIGNGGVRTKFEVWNRIWRSSNKVRGLESEMEEF